MRMAAADPAYAKARDIPQPVAQEFRADDLKKMRKKHRLHYMTGKTHAT